MDATDSAIGRESVLVGKQNRARQSVGLGEDPDVEAAPGAVEGEQPLPGSEGLFVDIAPITEDVAAQEVVG